MQENDIKFIEEKIGYRFNDKSLLIAAFTHSSYMNENKNTAVSYDRLEFLGDSILNFIVAEDLYFNFNKNEGEMSDLRSKTVSRGPLSETVDKLGIFGLMRIGHGAAKSVERSIKNKSDLFESILAAIYIDCGKNMDKPREFVRKHLQYCSPITRDFKSEFQIFTQKNLHGLKPVYMDIQSEKEGFFQSEVYVDGVLYGTGEGTSKKHAEQSAAQEALKKIGK